MGNYIQYLVINHNRKEYGKEYAYVYLNHFAVQLKLTVQINYISISKMTAAKSFQWCPTLHDPMGCSPPGPSIHGIFQARVLEWVAIPFSKSKINKNKTIHITLDYIHI